MAMIHKNLTPWFWGPKVTSRRPPQPEMAVCVRAVFRLEAGKPLEPIVDPIKQGFMSGDTFAEDDIDQKGVLLHPSDFAEWKPKAEFLLRGTCFPPNGSATECEVKFRVGSWQKSLRVVGPRVFRPGLLLGGKASEPLPFKSMPLTWENAYGGPGYPQNPAGRGHEGAELPTIERMGNPVVKVGKAGVIPAGFLPISPNWPQRSGKRGRNYGEQWKQSRAPFYSDDFDWSCFQSAPEDQQIEGYLSGDEDLQFVNLSPSSADWTVSLPGLRIRAFVKTADSVIREPRMNLDTLYADLEAGRLFLTWRGHVPIQKVDMSDVQVVLIAQESIAEPELPFKHYEDKLQEFAADPVGLEAAMPPGFLEVAKAIQAAELAERNGEPLPDLRPLAATLPPGCPFPPWFLAAASGDPDPLGVKAHFPPGMLEGDDPLALRDKIGDLGDEEKRDPVLEELAAAKDKPAELLPALRKLAELLPPGQQGSMLAGIAALEQGLDAARAAQVGSPELVGGSTQATAKPAAAAVNDMVQQLKGDVRGAIDGLGGVQTPDLAAVRTRLEGLAAGLAEVPSIDDVVAKALAPLDAMVLPELPVIPDVEAQLAAEREELDAQEAKMKKADGNNPMLALFGFGRKLIENAPRPGDLVPDFSPIVDGLKKTHEALLGAGIGAAALAPLARIQEKVVAIQAALPSRPPLPVGDYSGKSLRRRDFRGQDLRGMVFAGADLTGARFDGANLDGADFCKADATRAVFNGATLRGANLGKSILNNAKLSKVMAEGACFAGAELSEADLSESMLQQCDLQQVRAEKVNLNRAVLADSNLEFADLTKADLRHADLTRCRLTMAILQLAKADHACLRDSKADMTRFNLARMNNADLRGMQSAMGSFQGSDCSGADFTQCRFSKVDCMQARLDGALFQSADMSQVILRDTSAVGANFIRANLKGASATGKADFSKADFRNARAENSFWMEVELSGADFRGASMEFGSLQNCRGSDVDFAGARLKGACLRQVQLQRPRFAQADLCSADFTEAVLHDANFRDANCYDMKMLGAQAIRSDFTGAFTAGLQMDPNKKRQA
jgi:uncharacterized protein YjbI with pentapeptide repeats